MHERNNVSPLPLDVLSFSATWPSVSRGLAGMFFFPTPAGSRSVSGHRNSSVRRSPAGFNSVAGYTQEIGRG